MTRTKEISYGIRLAVIYGMIWFIDLLDASLLNVALPKISKYFSIDPTDAEWALIGFLLAMTLGMIISEPSGNQLGKKRVFVFAQWFYIFSSIGCALSTNFTELVFFRVIQGLSGGLAIPIGMAMLMSAMPADMWAKTGSYMNLFTLAAPALGPILAGLIVFYFNWRWLFFVKIPISIACALFSQLWIEKEPPQKKGRFDWFGFFFGGISISLLLLVLSEIGKPTFSKLQLIFFFVLILFFAIAFFWQEKRASHPLIPFKIFKHPHFSYGNLIQSAANMIFLGATFIIALYLQRGLGFSIVNTGWMMASITLGMASMMPLTGKFYNRLGPLPFVIPGLIVMAISMFAFIFIGAKTPFWIIACIIFLEGAGSAAVQTTNFVSIFCEVPKELKGVGSSLYSIFKQISASFGIALSTMMLSLQMGTTSLSSGAEIASTTFTYSFLLLGIIPLLALFCCLKISNKKALQKLKKVDHLKKEFEEGAE